MARPLPSPDPYRIGTNGNHHGYTHQDLLPDGRDSSADIGPELLQELDVLRHENSQLRSLCGDLEQALQEATQHGDPNWETQVREYEALLEEKSEMIRQLHQELQEAGAGREQDSAQQPAAGGPAPREEELLALSEELERERRQLQEDEQTLMDQMREMELSMARERAEMARQRNDLQRLRDEIAHELERLERSGALQSKIEGLKSKFQDATLRRGSAPQAANNPPPGHPTPTAPAPAVTPSRKDSLMGRLFGGSR